MSTWKMMLAVFAVCLVSCSQAIEDQYIQLSDGSPLSEVAIGGDTLVSFDGKNDLVIARAGAMLGLSARTPSVLHVSPSHEVAVLNFGDGSGQVFDLVVYRLVDGGEVDIRQFRASLQKHARSHGCLGAADVASIIFRKWLSDERFEVATEDFSRTQNCSSLNRTWRIDLRPKSKCRSRRGRDGQ